MASKTNFARHAREWPGRQAVTIPKLKLRRSSICEEVAIDQCLEIICGKQCMTFRWTPLHIEVHLMLIFILDAILSASVIGVLAYVVIATMPPESF